MKLKQLVTFSLAILAASAISSKAEVSDHSSEILSIEAELSTIEQTSSQYGEGLITNILEARKETLQLSLDALNFFKLSTKEGVVREYTIELTKPDPQRAEAILTEILRQRDIISKAEIEAAKGGGLLQALALSRVETEKLTLSQLQLGYFQAQYGLPIRSETSSSNSTTVDLEAAPESDQPVERETTAKVDSEPRSTWVFVERADDFTDKDASFVVLEPSSTAGTDSPSALFARCDGKGDYDIVITANGYIGGKNNRVKVRYRFGENKPITERWSESTNGKAAFLPSGYNDFRTALKTGENFIFEITDYQGSTSRSEYNNSKDENLDYVMNGCKE